MATAILVRKGDSYVNGQYVMNIYMYAGDAHASFSIKTPKGSYTGSFTSTEDGYFYATRELLVRVKLTNNTVVLSW